MSNTPTGTLLSTLADIKIGQKVMLCKNQMDKTLEKKLLALGFSKLIPLHVAQIRKGGIVVSIGNARIALNQALAQQIPIQAL